MGPGGPGVVYLDGVSGLWFDMNVKDMGGFKLGICNGNAGERRGLGKWAHRAGAEAALIEVVLR